MANNFNFKDSALWKKYLAQRDADQYSDARARLRSSFEQTRDMVSPLLAKIAQELPQLTVHDVTHVDALWNVGDVLIGKNYSLNPAEVYVLGLSFLLHDSATSSFAFEGGIQSVKATTAWRDFVAQNQIGEGELVHGSEKFQWALFETLRMLHAGRAETLLTTEWKDLNGDKRFLLEDVPLRNHYGRIAGQIAASHGLDAAVVQARWAHVGPIPPHSSMGLDAAANWSVNCLKIAMLLRCIDAAHIDSLRAPDMAACLHVPVGESKNHWSFQNKLGTVAINDKHEIYWSGPPFDKEKSDAWWRCYETCRMIDAEIRSANRILLEHGCESLAAEGVMGVGDIEIFQKNVPVEGWQPVDFGFRVSQVGSVIERFGGAHLYGDEPEWALRELIQNSADAIRARRVFCGKDSHGRLEIRLRSHGSDWWLDVIDDGIGMSRYVLTEVLLDFGRSLWTDASLRSQWEGLASKGFTSVGKFGIGFFSVFMLGDEVRLTTWAFGRAMEDQLTLHLRDRVSARPILSKPDPEDRLIEPGTKVSVRLRKGRSSLLGRIDAVPWKKNQIEKEERLTDLVGRLAPALDINTYVRDGSEPEVNIIVANDWKTLDAEALLRRIAPGTSKSGLKQHAKFLTSITEADGTVVGRACIHNDQLSFGEQCALVFRGIYAGKCQGISGLLISSNNSDLARVHSTPIASAEAMSEWVHHQILVCAGGNTPLTSERGVSLGILDERLIIGRLGGKLVSILDIVEKFSLAGMSQLKAIVRWPDCPDELSQSKFEDLELDDDVLDLSYGTATRRYDFGLPQWVSRIFPETEESPRNIFGTLVQTLQHSTGPIEVDEGDGRIGEIDGEEFKSRCIFFEKCGVDDLF